MSDQLSDLFPNQIILDILTRLPAKTIFRFRAVSKAWNSFITEPHFLTSYLSRNPPTWFTLERIIQLAGDPSETDPIDFIPSAHSAVVDLTVNPHLILKPDEPVSEPGRTAVVTPAEVFHSSNGLVLFGVNVNPDPVQTGRRVKKSMAYDALFVTNTTTLEWARLPKPPKNLDFRYGIMLLTRPGPVGEFVVGAFDRERRTGVCTLTCYGSETGKWVTKNAGNPLGGRNWMSFGRFEYQGKMCWSDSNAGVVIWEEDPFVGCVNEKKADCRLIPLPPGCSSGKGTSETMMQRSIDGVGEWIQYTELCAEGGIAVEVWRLKGYGKKSKKEGKKEGKWHLVYKVPRVVLEPYFGRGRWSRCGVSFVDPLDMDVLITGDGTLLSFDVRTRVVKSSRSFVSHTCVMPCVVPSWPTSLPPRLYAEYIKEKGNACFKGQDFIGAINCYSKSIALSPSVVAYANRAMAYLVLGKFCEAEEDCTGALSLDHKFFKAYGRRAIAREKLGNLKGALEDVKFAWKLQPDDQQMKERYAELKCLVDQLSLTEGELGQ